ncbi:hypothetical protein H2199_006396 [Coniosporium tulheliwenetii]|uniref:Uncharacterized protein n=1 Tax=Coniosporium tulheliwenetii TaxID=3383036 RepID=A0ACC2YWK6_9PEZI|nr:hypothetical protein H2199_006396 [Cladosporium sp. JES 115]
MLLVTAEMNLAQLSHNKLHAHLSDAEQKTHSLLNEQSNRLTELDLKLTENNRLVSSSGAAVIMKMTELLRLDWLRQMGTDLSSLVQVFVVNMATYKQGGQ